MNNGKSRLIPMVSSDKLAAILFFLSLITGILNSRHIWPWFAPITILIAIILFVLDSNTFVRKCMVQVLVFSLISTLSAIIFGTWFASIKGVSGFFTAIDWIIRSIIGIFTLISGIQALGGSRFNAPIIGKLVDGICDALRVY